MARRRPLPAPPLPALSSREVCELTGADEDLLDRCQRSGLVAPLRRTAAGRRRWHTSVLVRVLLARIALDAGYRWEDLPGLIAELPPPPAPVGLFDWQFALWRMRLPGTNCRPAARTDTAAAGCARCGCTRLRECTLLDAYATDALRAEACPAT